MVSFLVKEVYNTCVCFSCIKHNLNCCSLFHILDQRNIIIFHLAEKTSTAKEKAFKNTVSFCFVTEKGL